MKYIRVDMLWFWGILIFGFFVGNAEHWHDRYERKTFECMEWKEKAND